ncbi:MAG TPA: DUF748 domain-containing protein [Gammaproteobacteria bacterium]|nr:DUF748 domain-containing protein [Gammaproteobacteria bacterium]
MTMPPLLASRWFKSLLILSTLALGILAGLPLLIEKLAERWLAEQSGHQVEVQDVDFNPFTGILRLEGLTIHREDRTPLSFTSAELNLAWLPLWDKHIQVQSVALTGFRMVVRNEDVLKIGGIPLPASDADTTPAEPARAPTKAWAAGIEQLKLNDFTLLYHDRELHGTVHIDTLSLSKLAQWAPEQAAQLDYKGSINDAPVTLNATLKPFATTASYNGTLSIEKLDLSAIEPLLQPELKKLQGLASLGGDFHVEQNAGALRVRHDGTLSLQALELDHPQARVRNQAIDWAGKTELALATGPGTLQLDNQGKLTLAKLGLELPDSGLKVMHDALQLDGTFSFDNSAEQPAVDLSADIGIDALTISAPEKEVDLINAGRMHIAGLHFRAPQQVEAEEITLDDINLGRSVAAQQGKEPGQAFFRAEQLRISKLLHDGTLTSIDAIHEQNVHVLYHRDKDGNWTVNTLVGVLLGEEKEAPDATQPDAGKTVADSSEAATQEPPTRLKINRLSASSGSSITILDEAVKPVFRETLTCNALSLEDLDTEKPDQPSPLQMDCRIGKHTVLTSNGWLKPFQQPPGLDLKGKLNAMDLPPLTGYTRDSLGVELDSGTLDVDLTLKSENRVMQGKATLKLHQLELESVNVENSLQSKIPVPLNVALNTLRDRNNTIELDIPIHGDANNPGFDVSDAISQAFATGLKAGAVSYLKYALQPYGALIMVAEYAGEAATKVRLKAVEFEPGQTELDDGDRDYLSKVAGILKDRPKLAIKLCGIATRQDALYFQQQVQAKAQANKAKPAGKDTPPPELVINEEQLRELARQRAARVKTYMVETFKSPADHLVGCRPRLETDAADAVARTDLLL